MPGILTVGNVYDIYMIYSMPLKVDFRSKLKIYIFICTS